MRTSTGGDPATRISSPTWQSSTVASKVVLCVVFGLRLLHQGCGDSGCVVAYCVGSIFCC